MLISNVLMLIQTLLNAHGGSGGNQLLDGINVETVNGVRIVKPVAADMSVLHVMDIKSLTEVIAEEAVEMERPRLGMFVLTVFQIVRVVSCQDQPVVTFAKMDLF